VVVVGLKQFVVTELLWTVLCAMFGQSSATAAGNVVRCKCVLTWRCDVTLYV
jgi:hypothetical protein